MWVISLDAISAGNNSHIIYDASFILSEKLLLVYSIFHTVSTTIRQCYKSKENKGLNTV